MNSQSKQSFLFLFVDFILINISFFAMHYLKQGTLTLSPIYYKLLFIIYFVPLMVSVLTKKYGVNSYMNHWQGLWVQIKSIVFSVYVLALMIVFIGLPAFSRLQIFGTFLILLILEMTALSIYYLCRGKNVTVPPNKIHTTKNATINISIFRLLNEFLLITVPRPRRPGSCWGPWDSCRRR